ncbi:MAG: EAL domain-containing protein [Proteobacteria bacterium]|nr:EAL domain-containing protein [Pseudomonadota bacterium]
MPEAAAFLVTSYDRWVVVASLLIATLASYVTLDVTRRVRAADRGLAKSWWVGGSIVLGTGIWSTHFVGMLAMSLPIELGYTKGLTLLSWVAAVAVCGLALGIAGHSTLTPRRLAGGSLAMGAGISAMHYLGMAALELSPGIVWNWWLIALSVVIAAGASGAALMIFFWLRAMRLRRGAALIQLGAACVMGIAICGMHYTGMAAASFPTGTLCLSANVLAAHNLELVVSVSAVLLLALTLLTSILDARMQSTATRLAESLQQTNHKLQQANAELQERALLDPLTGLSNRVLFEDRLAHALERLTRSTLDRNAARTAGRLAVLFVDLDGFKPVNDSLGHAAGDLVLKDAARRLRVAAREDDTVARVGGDEFLVLMEGVPTLADCVQLARRLVQALAEPFDVAGQQVRISGSIGIVVHPDQGQRDKLVAHADAAMYAAKRAGGNTYALFEAHMDAGALEQLNLQNDLRHAAELGQLQLHYQPKVDADRGQIRGVEALLRWNHPQRGMVSPGEFIPVAERFGLINALGLWVIEEACRQMAAWADDGLRMRVAINLSVHQLRDDDLVPSIRDALERHGVEPSRLLCEITESVAMEDILATQRTFDRLARIGVFIAIDDFGTGYSSLSYLRQLPARQLKIDRSFVGDLETSSDARAVVDAVVRLAHALGLVVVAEGVETEGQRDILVKLGCDELQGYFYARPMPPATLLAWARGNKPEGVVDFSPSVLVREAA